MQLPHLKTGHSQCQRLHWKITLIVLMIQSICAPLLDQLFLLWSLKPKQRGLLNPYLLEYDQLNSRLKESRMRPCTTSIAKPPLSSWSQEVTKRSALPCQSMDLRMKMMGMRYQSQTCQWPRLAEHFLISQMLYLPSVLRLPAEILEQDSKSHHLFQSVPQSPFQGG